jgi:hypothetical protein
MTLPESEPWEEWKHREQPGQVPWYQSPLTSWYTMLDTDFWTGLKRDIIERLKHLVSDLHKLVFLQPLQRKRITNWEVKECVTYM